MQRGVRDQSHSPGSLWGTLAKATVCRNPKAKPRHDIHYVRDGQMFRRNSTPIRLAARDKYTIDSTDLDRDELWENRRITVPRGMRTRS